jgi:hypothetical protein
VKTDPTGIDEGLWERLRHRGAPVKQRVLTSLPESAGPLVADRLWQSFKQQCAAQGNVLPLLISQLEAQDLDPGMFRRRRPRKPKGSDPFEDLPVIQHLDAMKTFWRLCARWEGNLPTWRRAILAGVARRLTLHPPDSEWGRRMRRIKGGLHCQRKYREQGRHPLAEYNQAMTKRRNDVASTQSQGFPVRNASQRRADDARERLGITPERMRGVPRVTPLLESAKVGIDQFVDGLRWSHEDDAIAFLQKYDSVPPADIPHLSIEEICVAAGVDPRWMLVHAADAMLDISIQTAKLHLAVSYPDIARAAVKRGRSPGGFRDRRMILEIAGVLPGSRVAPAYPSQNNTVPGTDPRRAEFAAETSNPFLLSPPQD